MNKGSKRPLEKSANGTNTFISYEDAGSVCERGLWEQPTGRCPPPPGIIRRCGVFGLGLINSALVYGRQIRDKETEYGVKG